MAQCSFPYAVERKIFHNQADRLVNVPCGRCPNCLRRRLASWSFRLEVESLRWKTQMFLTLTFNNEHVPITKNGFLTLDKSVLVKFFKRLRKRVGKICYYAVGEYGTQNKRPHFHVILFGTSSLEHKDVMSAWVSPETKTLIGDVYFGNVEAGSIRYCVQYYDKGIWQRAHERDDRISEYSVMSQGIGKDFMTPKMVSHFLENPSKGYIYDKEGRKIAIPRYFKKRLFDYFGTDRVVMEHPSILIHRDDMLTAKQMHQDEMELLISQLEQPEQTEELHKDRMQQIINYRNSKRKTRK